jgi:hypothetical protein
MIQYCIDLGFWYQYDWNDKRRERHFMLQYGFIWPHLLRLVYIFSIVCHYRFAAMKSYCLCWSSRFSAMVVRS